MGKRVLITGGAGFIGSHMADRLLAEGHRVILLDNESTGFKRNVPAAAHYLKGDVTDPAALEEAFRAGLDAVFHIAGQTSTILSFQTPEEDLRVNVGGTVRVIQKCLEHRVPRLLYASSMTAYGHPQAVPTPEREPCRPISYYGITKYAAERYVHATAERTDLPAPFAVTSFRMFNVYGERQGLTNPYQGVVGIFIGNILRGEPITIHSDGEQTRDFVHIEDVVEAWVRALDSPQAHGQVFNLGLGAVSSVNQLVDAVLAAMGRSRKDYQVSYAPVRPGDQRHMRADISLARNVLGWQPRVSLEQGMARTVRWALENQSIGQEGRKEAA